MFNYYYYEILNFTLWHSSVSPPTTGTELDSKISYLICFTLIKKMDEVHMEGHSKNEWLGA
jgi:hypothetical protein